jgi:hypothetical protein
MRIATNQITPPATERARRTMIGVGVVVGSLIAVTGASAIGWSRQVTIAYPGTGQLAGFGNAVAISGDGGTLAVGSPDAANGTGLVAIYTRADGHWIRRQVIANAGRAARDAHGASVALSHNGATLVVGADGAVGYATV